MSLALPEPDRTASDRPRRSHRGRRLRLAPLAAAPQHHPARVLAARGCGSSMILICSAVFWVGLFVLFFGGFQFIGMYVDLANTIVEYLFSMFFLSLLVMLFFSTGIIVYTGALPVARGGVPADDARPRPTGSSPTSSPRRSASRAGASSCWAAR